MDSENRNTFKKKKFFYKISGRGLRVCPLWELSTGSCPEQMLCTLDRASAAGRDAWRHLKQPVLGLLVGNAVGEKNLPRITVPKIIRAFEESFLPTN